MSLLRAHRRKLRAHLDGQRAVVAFLVARLRVKLADANLQVLVRTRRLRTRLRRLGL